MKKLIALPLALFSAGSFAAVDAGVSTALSEAATDVGTVGLAVFMVIIGIMAYKWFRRAL